MPVLFAVPLAVLAVLLVLVTAPVSFPLIALVNACDKRHLRDAANRMRCERCGAPLGPPAVDAAETAHHDALADMHRRYPNHRVHVVRRAYARCTRRDAEYGWNGRRRALHLLPSDPPLDPAALAQS